MISQSLLTAQGRREERLATLRRLIQWRFGEVPALEARLATADEAELDLLLEQVLTAVDPASLLE